MAFAIWAGVGAAFEVLIGAAVVALAMPQAAF
jgi:hypothetical protein